ncbi:MAG: ArsR family transcriptional regulator [Conexivisphaera sp.]
MRTRVISLGFDATPAIALVSRLGTAGDDGYLFVGYGGPSSSVRAKPARQAILEFFSGLAAHGVDVKVDFVEAVGNPDLDVPELALRLADAGVVEFYVLGGMRYHAVLLYVVSQVLPGESAFYVTNEATMDLVRFPVQKMRDLREGRVDVLRALLEGPTTERRLALLSDRSQSRVSRILKELVAAGLVEGPDPHKYRLTGLGRAYLALRGR